MSQYIKSHSNYVLKKRHQDVSDGTIWERDITTIGGVNQFSPGQVPIYKSSNFIITVRNDGKISNQFNQVKWKENESGNTWTLQTISGMTSEFEDQNDVKIVLKQDYYDFCDFAYYGSLTEMFRASITDILQRFPGELYCTESDVYYTTSMTYDFEKVEEEIILGNGNEKLVSNPFSIDIHSVKKPADGNYLKFFADEGYKNYQIIGNDGEAGKQIYSWHTKNFIKVVRKKSELDALFGNDAFYYDWLEPEILSCYFNLEETNEIWWVECSNTVVSEKSKYKNTEYSTPDDSGSTGYDLLVKNFKTGEIRSKFNEYDNGYWVEKNGIKCDPESGSVYSDSGEAFSRMEELASEDPDNTYTIGHGANCCDIRCYVTSVCKGYQAARVSLNDNNDNNDNVVVIGAWVGDNNQIVYLSKNFNKHIRPLEKFIIEFYNECNNFEKIILDRKTTPKYKSLFSVIQDNEKGYFRKLEEFIFPTSYGGYNVDANSNYVNRLTEIGTYYDEYFTDNLWRSMTHEAIKNFDWTYTREYIYGAENEYIQGGEKMQKALRIFAREFDEILTYINNIKNVGRVTYDERSNVPDYFLIDEVENSGFDVCLTYPYDLIEYTKNDNGDKNYFDNYDKTEQLENKHDNKQLLRQFSQNTKKEVKPYSKDIVDFYSDGYFISCCGGKKPCYYNDVFSGYTYIDAHGMGTTYYDPCDGKLKNRIKSYTDERSYTYLDANNEFMRRMAINSPHITSHKGTIEGIEMMLGMFGFKSKRWVESFPLYRQDCDNKSYDYDIVEYSSFTNRIEEKWDAIHQMYRIDWINSTKAIVYDYRSTSNYTKYGTQTNYLSYQGLPISFRDEYSTAAKPYLKVSPLKPDTPQDTTSSSIEAFKVAETNEPVFRRYLYPNFSKTEQLDGNPYFQMDGGWLSKTLENVDDSRYNFQYDVDDNITYTCYVHEGEDSESGVIDNHPIYKETVRNIKRVDNIAELISTPMELLKEGTIYYVSNIEQNVALINNQVYEIKYEYNGETNLSRYILFTKNDEYIKVGDDLFFTDVIYVYDKEGNENPISLGNMPSGFEVKAYIKNDNTFMCKGDESGYYTIDNFKILENALPASGFTNYFIIDNPYYSDRIVNANDSNDINGWRALKDTDPEYIKINTIINYFEGNNPHNGNMVYDNGHEYFTYFKRLFKYPIDEDLFDERCYENFMLDSDNEIYNIGFSGLIDDNEVITQYTPYLIPNDSKIHYFGTYYPRNGRITNVNKAYFYGENNDKKNRLETMYRATNSSMNVEEYILNDDKMIGGSPYVAQRGTVDEVTNQILNNKRFTIKFYLHDKWYTNKGQCELKYIDDIVMNYLTQMIPSTAIVDIQYIGT